MDSVELSGREHPHHIPRPPLRHQRIQNRRRICRVLLRYAVLPDGGDYLLGIQPFVLRLLVQPIPPCDVHAVRDPQRICQLALKHIPPRRIAARNEQLSHSLLQVFRSDRANCVNERSRMMCEIGEHRHATGFTAHFHPPLDAGKTAEAGLNLFPGQAELTRTNYQRHASIGTATSECWRLTRRGGSWWRQMPAGSWGRGVRYPGQIQCAQILALSGQDTQRDICGHSCWRASTGCFHSSVAGAAGGCAWLGSSQSRRRCGRYWNM